MASQPQLAVDRAYRTLAEPGYPIRVVLADDHRVVRRTLRLLLDEAGGIEVVREAIDLDGAARHVHAHAPHVLVIDLDLPNGSTLLTLGELRRRAPRTEIVVLAMEPSPLFATRVLRAGAAGYVLKDQADSELAAAIRAAARGERYVSPQVSAALGAADAVERDGGLRTRAELVDYALGHGPMGG